MRLYFIHWTHGDPYFNLSTHADQERTFGHEVMQTPWWQVFHNTASMVAVITSVLAGSFVGLLLAAFTLPLWAGTSAGIVIFLLSIVLLQRYQWRQFMRLARAMPVFFPSQVGV